MCLILDSNILPLVIGSQPTNDFQPVNKALLGKKATAVYGGELAREYQEIKRLTRIITELDRQGIFRLVEGVDEMTKTVVREDLCVSNDHHIIALARLSGVRLLCSDDKDLHTDFTNPEILKPRGSVYQDRSHRHLIREHCG